MADDPQDDNNHEAELARAKEVLSQLQILSSDKVEQVHQRGTLLNEWSERRLYKRLRHGSKKDVLDRIGLRPSTASSDQQLAAKFNLAIVKHLGLGKARLLAANFIDDPMSVVYDGLDLPDGNGGVEHFNVEELSYRELQALLKRYRASKPVQAPVDKPRDELQLKIEAAAETILEDLEQTALPAATATQEHNAEPQDEPPLKTEAVAEPTRDAPEPSTTPAEQASEGVEEAPSEEPLSVGGSPGDQAHKGRRRRRRHGRS